MPSSKHWADPDDADDYMDDEGNVIYTDRTGRLRKFKKSDKEYQQQYHYYEDD